ncbi:hypothetical protein STEG23_031584, partial [Scotinomys teguina]
MVRDNPLQRRLPPPPTSLAAAGLADRHRDSVCFGRQLISVFPKDEEMSWAKLLQHECENLSSPESKQATILSPLPPPEVLCRSDILVLYLDEEDRKKGQVKIGLLYVNLHAIVKAPLIFILVSHTLPV